MSVKLRSLSYFIIIFFFTSSFLIAQPYPKDFYLEYDLFHAEKKIGSLNINCNQEKNKYRLEVNLKTLKILKLYGDRKIISKGQINKDGFLTNTFELINQRNPKKNILAQFNRQKKSIEINYKKEKKEKKYSESPIDIATLFFQFNYEKNNRNGQYSFDVLEGKNIRKFQYKKLNISDLKINSKKIKVDVFEGLVVNKNNTNHQLWLSKGTYRIPIKLRLKTNFGLLINQVLVKTNIPLDKNE